MTKEVLFYQDAYGNIPFLRWYESLKDQKTISRIDRRLASIIQYDHFGDFKSLSGGVKELRLQFGSGYRIYYGEHENKVVVLLCGGDKSSQKRDIENAKQYWQEYISRLK